MSQSEEQFEGWVQTWMGSGLDFVAIEDALAEVQHFNSNPLLEELRKEEGKLKFLLNQRDREYDKAQSNFDEAVAMLSLRQQGLRTETEEKIEQKRARIKELQEMTEMTPLQKAAFDLWEAFDAKNGDQDLEKVHSLIKAYHEQGPRIHD